MTWQPPLNLEDQSFNGLESDDCWDFSGVSLLEIYLKSIFTQFSPDAQSFFISNGFCDAEGNFALSRRYIAVISGVKNYGNYQEDFWTLAGQYGIIPRSMLDFTPTSQNDPNYATFVADFFNTAAVTQAMKDLGQQFLKYVSIASKDISYADIPEYIQKAPLQVGIAIPKNISSWNQANVQWDGSTQTQHAVVLLSINLDGTRSILDSYLQWQKTLSADYPLNIITFPMISIIQPDIMLSPILSLSTWQQFIAILKKIGVL